MLLVSGTPSTREDANRRAEKQLYNQAGHELPSAEMPIHRFAEWVPIGS
jgi:hypothetical protein